MINSIIGKYKITRFIGEGGMASVYEAVHEMLGTKVAIKVLNPILSANETIKKRFRNEAVLMASLDHPNITKVIDFDEQPQQLSIIMEFLSGEDLQQRIKKRGRLADADITALFAQILSAFQYAHDKGIIHRDIKPSNIFILPNGHVKILDFGIAKLVGPGNEMTQTGNQMGTPVYMSPEQVKADKSIDYRSDIYSLGITLFYVINGKPPYNTDVDSAFDIFTKIVYEPLPELAGQSQFREIMLKACQKNRADRFQGCQEWLLAMAAKTNRLNTQGDQTIFSFPENEKTNPTQMVAKGALVQKSNQQSDPIQETKTPNYIAPSQDSKSKKNKIAFWFLIGIILLLIGFWGATNFNKSSVDFSTESIFADNPPMQKKVDSTLKLTDEINSSETEKSATTPIEDENQLKGDRSRFMMLDKTCINDLSTNHLWHIAPDVTFDFEEAIQYSYNLAEQGMAWRLPSYSEIKTLYNKQLTAGMGYETGGQRFPAKIDPVFNAVGTGSWFWVSDEHSDVGKAYAINMHNGIRVTFDQINPQYPVHLLLLSK
jgi:serine/threonine protein kinase